jgi:hypothetical protein
MVVNKHASSSFFGTESRQSEARYSLREEEGSDERKTEKPVIAGGVSDTKLQEACESERQTGLIARASDGLVELWVGPFVHI